MLGYADNIYRTNVGKEIKPILSIKSNTRSNFTESQNRISAVITKKLFPITIYYHRLRISIVNEKEYNSIHAYLKIALIINK